MPSKKANPKNKEIIEAVMQTMQKDFYQGETAAAKEMKERWGSDGGKHLLGRRIVGVRYLNQKEVDALGWYRAAVVLILDDGTMIFPSRDDEGNNAGALFGQTKDGEEITLPVI